MFNFIRDCFNKVKVEETEEDRHKLRICCEKGEWTIETKEDEPFDGSYFWCVRHRTERQEEARIELQKWRNKIYNIHNGTCEYW